MTVVKPIVKKNGTKGSLANLMPKQNANYLSRFKLSMEITEDCELYAEVSSLKDDEEEVGRAKVKFTPFDLSTGKRVYYEPVYLTLERTNTPSSPAGQFLTLFCEARNWGDIQDRVVGLKIKLNEGKDGRIFKNIQKVFVTDLDDLIFDDEHMLNAPDITSGINSVIYSDEDEEDEEESTPVASERTKSLLDDDEDDLDLEEEE